VIFDYLVDDLINTDEDDRAKYLFFLGIALRNEVQNTLSDLSRKGGFHRCC
jgi:hypothetical protein